MRRSAAAVMVVLLAGCGQPAGHAPVPSANAARHVDPSNIRRVRRDLPPGYEVAPVTNVIAPSSVWGLGGAGAAIPARCAPLAEPVSGQAQRGHGISGSGSGGTVYAVVVPSPGPVTLDHLLVAQCPQWSMTGPRASARIHLLEAPHIDAADTVGMAADVVTAVEGGNEIASQATTFTAYLGDCYAFTTLIRDPGAPDRSLSPQYAADLLVKTVSALRG